MTEPEIPMAGLAYPSNVSDGEPRSLTRMVGLLAMAWGAFHFASIASEILLYAFSPELGIKVFFNTSQHFVLIAKLLTLAGAVLAVVGGKSIRADEAHGRHQLFWGAILIAAADVIWAVSNYYEYQYFSAVRRAITGYGLYTAWQSFFGLLSSLVLPFFMVGYVTNKES